MIARLNDQLLGNDLVDNIAPQIKRNSGFLRIEHAGYRRGDNAEMAIISFVDEIKEKVAPKAAEKAEKAVKAPAKAKKEEK